MKAETFTQNWEITKFRDKGKSYDYFGIITDYSHVCYLSNNAADPQANAKLIAASPDLLRAAQELVKSMHSLPTDLNPQFAALKEAIKKATT
jgi:hypothetical protein